MARSILRGRVAVDLFEVTHEVAVVRQPDSNHNLLHVEESVLKQLAGFKEAQLFLILRGRHSYFRLEESAQVFDRQTYGLSHLIECNFAAQVVLNETYHRLNSWVHAAHTETY